jgi:hypothetical protein
MARFLKERPLALYLRYRLGKDSGSRYLTGCGIRFEMCKKHFPHIDIIACFVDNAIALRYHTSNGLTFKILFLLNFQKGFL